MAIKEVPIKLIAYYRSMRSKIQSKLESAIKQREVYDDSIKKRYESILRDKEAYRENFGLDVLAYEEFRTNTYIDGTFLKATTGIFINRSNCYIANSESYSLYKFANMQKKYHDICKDIDFYERLLKLSFTDYTEIVRAYYTQVHKELILNGNGYAFSNNIGWIVINRVILRKPKPMIDYAATKKREKELRAEGKRIYNEDEAKWCAEHGLEYKAEDKRVFKTNEYCYEIPLIGCKLTNGTKYKLEISDYRHTYFRGKTNDDIIAECNNDINKICDLKLDLKTKLTLCDKASKILYNKFIRNENQTSVAATKINRKDR